MIAEAMERSIKIPNQSGGSVSSVSTLLLQLIIRIIFTPCDREAIPVIFTTTLLLIMLTIYKLMSLVSQVRDALKGVIFAHKNSLDQMFQYLPSRKKCLHEQENHYWLVISLVLLVYQHHHHHHQLHIVILLILHLNFDILV